MPATAGMAAAARTGCQRDKFTRNIRDANDSRVASNCRDAGNNREASNSASVGMPPTSGMATAGIF